MTSAGATPSEPQQDGRQLQKPSPRATGFDLLFLCCVLHHQDKQTQPGPGALLHLSRTVALSQPVGKPPQTPGEACDMAEPWHSPCSRQHQELQGSGTWAWSALLLPEMDQGKESLGSVQAFLKHVPCRYNWQTSPPVAFPRAAALGCVSTRNTQALGDRAHYKCAGDPTGDQGHCPKSQTSGKTTHNHPLNISSPRAHFCDWVECGET